jgi:hypothetical protein
LWSGSRRQWKLKRPEAERACHEWLSTNPLQRDPALTRRITVWRNYAFKTLGERRVM